MTTPVDSGSYLDVTGKRENLRVMDVNGDGLVEIVVTESSKIRTYLNLGRYPGGAGHFGTATWTSATTATLREAPLEACLPGEDTALHFVDRSVLTGDFNGDGLIDVAELRLGKLTYYPGRGDGSWGVVPPPGCGRRPAGVRSGVELALPTSVVASSDDAVRVADVTGDGLDDVIHVSGRDVDVYVNQSGVALSTAPLHARTDRMGTLRPELVRVADVNGNGTADVVIGTDAGYAYLDVIGATRPNVLTRMSNGRGATTDVLYESSTTRMLADAAAGAPWERTTPIVTHVVRSVTVDDHLPVAGRPASRKTTTYDYRDPVYDGAQREFRGFATVLSRTSGDRGSPPSTTRTRFLTGDCVDETADRVDDCAPEGRWRAHGREALRGLAVSAETFADSGVYLSTLHTTYTLRHLFTGLVLPWVTNEDPAHYPLDRAPSTPSTLHEYDAFGREIRTTDPAGAVARELHLHALTTDIWDGADLRSQAHEGTFTTERRDGHGRLVSMVERMKVGSASTLAETRTDYLATGEVARITRTANGQAPVVRWMRYDSLGRLVENADPHTTRGFALSPATDGSMRALRYAYDDVGDLVGTSDARGCGVNFVYDAGGREIGQDFSPCLASQQPYTAPDWVTGDGTEVFYRYDEPEADTPAECPEEAALLLGRVSSVSDRGGRLVTSYDARGRIVCASRRVAKPGDTASSLDERYAANWFSQQVVFDDADRAISQSTGASAIELLGKDGTSAIRTSYTARGLLDVASSSYGPLVNAVRRDASGKVTRIDYADGAQTQTRFTYDANQRVSTVTTSRGAPSLWTQSTATYAPAPSGAPSTLQRVLDDLVFGYDEVGNPVPIQDNRDPSEWPAGAKPVSRTISYDDAYRATDVAYSYAVASDAWMSPHDADERGVHPDPRRARPAPDGSFDSRVLRQTASFDALGNTTATEDDAHGFYDRSLGTITNDFAAGRPYQMVAASNETSGATRRGQLSAAYDDAGYLVSLALSRDGPCLPAAASCSMRMAYDWDEVGNLVRARRWDPAAGGVATHALPAAPPAVDLRYAYDTAHVRVLKAARDTSGEERHTVYPMATLELRGARYDNGAYERTALTEVPHLFAHGVRLARVVHAVEDLPSLTSGRLHVFLNLPDHLGSTSTVLDRDTGEVVERATYLAFGGTESDDRPERWASFREDHRFTGKEDDSEVGLLNGVGEIAQSMAAKGWAGAPLDVVRLESGLVTVDNTRVLAAHMTNTPVQTVVRGAGEALPASMAGRFGNATTWREAVLYRIGNQNAAYRSLFPNGSWAVGVGAP